jgi:hypothetical protein
MFFEPVFQYDYRRTNGELFSCCRPTLDLCRITPETA